MGLNENHLKNIGEVKNSLKTLSETPVPGADVANLNKRVDVLQTLLKQYITAEAAIKAEHDAIAKLEEKLKADLAKLAPKITNLNGMRGKLKDGAQDAYNWAIPMSQKLAKLPAYSKANAAIKKCIDEMLGTKNTYSVKLKNDGDFDL